MTESEKNDIATDIARACFKAKHLREYNPHTHTIDPLLCEDCDKKIGVLFP